MRAMVAVVVVVMRVVVVMMIVVGSSGGRKWYCDEGGGSISSRILVEGVVVRGKQSWCDHHFTIVAIQQPQLPPQPSSDRTR